MAWAKNSSLCSVQCVHIVWYAIAHTQHCSHIQCIRLSYCQFHSNQINSSSRGDAPSTYGERAKKSINNFEWLHSVRVDFPISPTLISVSIEAGKCAAANVWVFEFRAGSDKCSILFISTGIEWKCAANSYSLGIASLRPWINRNDHHLLHWI